MLFERTLSVQELEGEYPQRPVVRGDAVQVPDSEKLIKKIEKKIENEKM